MKQLPEEDPLINSESARVIDPQAELRKRWIDANKARTKQETALLAQGVDECDIEGKLTYVDWKMFTELICGAKGKRTGKPCAQKTFYANGRCKFHGGLSTGPKTAQGRAKSGRNGLGKASVIDAATGLE